MASSLPVSQQTARLARAEGIFYFIFSYIGTKSFLNRFFFLTRFGHVDFETVEQAEQALKSLQASEVDGRQITLDYAPERQRDGNASPGGFGGRGGGRGGFGGGRGGGFGGGFGGRGGARGGRGGAPRGGGRGGFRGGRGGASGGFNKFEGKKMTFSD